MLYVVQREGHIQTRMLTKRRQMKGLRGSHLALSLTQATEGAW